MLNQRRASAWMTKPLAARAGALLMGGSVLFVMSLALGCDDQRAASKPGSAAPQPAAANPATGAATPQHSAAPAPTPHLSEAETEKQCASGDPKKCIELADRLRRAPSATPSELQRAVLLYQNACDRRVADGCAGLGAMVQDGLGIAQDVPRALSLYRQACDAKSGRGCSRLGVLYAIGAVVPKDAARALGYSQAGCDSDDGMGCMNVGMMYEHGDGVPADLGRAREMYSKACALNEGGGCRQLGTLYATGFAGEAANPKLAALFTEKACALSDGAGCGNAGMNYQVGFGVARDSLRAARLYKAACDLGQARFCELIQRFEAGATKHTQ